MPPVQKSQLEELSTVAQNVINNITTALGVQDLPDSNQVIDILSNQTKTLASNVKDIATRLQGEVGKDCIFKIYIQNKIKKSEFETHQILKKPLCIAKLRDCLSIVNFPPVAYT